MFDTESPGDDSANTVNAHVQYENGELVPNSNVVQEDVPYNVADSGNFFGFRGINTSLLGADDTEFTTIEPHVVESDGILPVNNELAHLNSIHNESVYPHRFNPQSIHPHNLIHHSIYSNTMNFETMHPHSLHPSNLNSHAINSHAMNSHGMNLHITNTYGLSSDMIPNFDPLSTSSFMEPTNVEPEIAIVPGPQFPVHTMQPPVSEKQQDIGERPVSVKRRPRNSKQAGTSRGEHASNTKAEFPGQYTFHATEGQQTTENETKTYRGRKRQNPASRRQVGVNDESEKIATDQVKANLVEVKIDVAPKKKRGAPPRKKPTLMEIIEKEEVEVAEINIPEKPNGLEHYIATETGEIYDPQFNTHEDMRRWSCKNLSELQSVGPSIPDKTKINPEFFPFFENSNQLFKDGTQYWLTGAVAACKDYNDTTEMLKTGTIQAAIHAFRDTGTVLDQMWLLILIRLAASCKTAGHLLVYSSHDIYTFLLKILQQTNEHFYLPIKKRLISDSRGYEHFLILAMAAHTRPLLTSTKPLPYREEMLYKNHAHLMVRAYGNLAMSDPALYIAKLPKHLAKHHKTLTTHDMAVEIFVDLAKYGLYSHFSTSIMSARWAKILANLLKRRKADIVTVQLCQIIHQAPRAVVSRLDNPYFLNEKCLEYLVQLLSDILNNEFFNHSGGKKVDVPVKFAISCAKALISMAKSAELNPNVGEKHLQFMRRESVQTGLVCFVLTAPHCDKWISKDENRELYESIWTLLHTISFTFPFMMETLMDYACDQDAPLCLSGHAAMFVGSVIAFAKYKATKRQVYLIYCILRRYAIESTSEIARQLRLEIAFRISLFLEVDKFDTNEPNAPAKISTSRTIFSSYKYKEEREESKSCCPKPLYVDVLKYLEDDVVEPLSLREEAIIIENGIYRSARLGHKTDNGNVSDSESCDENCNDGQDHEETDNASDQGGKR